MGTIILDSAHQCTAVTSFLWLRGSGLYMHHLTAWCTRERKETLVHSLYERADIQNNAIQKTMHHDKVDPTATYQLRSFKEASLQKRVVSTDRHKTQTRNSPCRKTFVVSSCHERTQDVSCSNIQIPCRVFVATD